MEPTTQTDAARTPSTRRAIMTWGLLLVITWAGFNIYGHYFVRRYPPPAAMNPLYLLPASDGYRVLIGWNELPSPETGNPGDTVVIEMFTREQDKKVLLVHLLDMKVKRVDDGAVDGDAASSSVSQVLAMDHIDRLYRDAAVALEQKKVAAEANELYRLVQTYARPEGLANLKPLMFFEVKGIFEGDRGYSRAEQIRLGVYLFLLFAAGSLVIYRASVHRQTGTDQSALNGE